MPIKGLSERRRLPRVGKIHLGIMVKTDKQGKECAPYPKAVDYFVLPKEHAQYDELVKAFGEQPKALRVLIPVEDEEKFASQYYRCYSKSRGLICRGDGDTAMRLIDTQTGAMADRDSKNTAMKEVPCQGAEGCPDYQDKCKELMCLQFLLPEITGMGVWQIDTSSKNSIININSGIELSRDLYGRVAMVPLLLTLEPIDVRTPHDGKTKTVRILNLRSKDKLLELAKRRDDITAQLTAGAAEDDITEAEVKGDVIEGEAVVLPVPDDERPELVTQDWEGAPGDPVSPGNLLSPEKIREMAVDLWPKDGEGEVTADDDKLTAAETASRMNPAEIAAAAEEAEPASPSKERGKAPSTRKRQAKPEPAAEVKAEPAVPQTYQELLTWVLSHGKQYSKTWFHNNSSYQEADLVKDDPAVIANSYAEMKELAGWKD